MVTLLEYETTTINMQKLFSFFKKNSFFSILCVCFLAFLARIGYVNDYIPFGFDHGKDSLAIMDLVLNQNIKFIGPWTSIPGLYFGPGWYYLLAPGLLLSQFNPIGSVLIMLVLGILQAGLVYKYFGKNEALIVSVAPFWLMLSKSAWNPFPMTLLTWIILIIFQLSKKVMKISTKHVFLLGVVASMGFHFSAAFAIFYPILIILFFIKTKIAITPKQILLAVIGFIIPFIPQMLFEIKHEFVQTKAVISYFKQGEPHQSGIDKLQHVYSVYTSELLYFIYPDTINDTHKLLITSLFLVVLFFAIKYSMQNKKIIDKNYIDIIDLIPWLVIPFIGYQFLHFNVWYVYALAPISVLLLTRLLNNNFKLLTYLVLISYFISPFISYYKYYQYDKPSFEKANVMLATRLKVVDYIYERSNGKPFSSYHYLPDIYDYSYQYIYFWKAVKGKTLPEDFSYKPNESIYVKEKPGLLEHFNQTVENPEKIFYVVESPENNDFLDAWWNEQKYGAIVNQVEVGNDITIYEATPR